MCLSIPARVLSIHEDTATVDASGNTLEVNLALLDEVAIDDFVLVHAGFAIEKYEPQEAQEVLGMLRDALGGPPETIPR